MSSPPIEIKELKLGLISQNTPTLNPFSLYSSLFNSIHPKSTIIKSQHSFQYIPAEDPSLKISLRQITQLDKLKEMYNYFHSIIIMVDIQKDSTLKELSSFLDCILEASDYEPRKVYIFGFYQGSLTKQIQENKFTKIIDAKNIDYEYIDLDVRDIKEFSKVMDYLVKESIENEMNKNKENKHSDMVLDIDNSKSNCIIY